MSSSVPEPWGKYFSKSKQAWYYHNKVTKASFFMEDDLPDGWAFVWEGTNKTYFNIITNQRVNSKNEIPQGQSGSLELNIFYEVVFLIKNSICYTYFNKI